MDNLGLELALASVKATILNHPASESKRQSVEDALQGVLKNTSSNVHVYSIVDFLKLMELSILAVGYSRKGIDNITLLTTLAEVVPPSLGVEILFPIEERETGGKSRRRVWHYTDVTSELPIISANQGHQPAYRLIRKFGNYAMFLSGIMPDLLIMVSEKGGVDIPYYELFGSSAFKSAARNPLFDGTHFAGTLDGIASGFRRYRMLLNEAATVIGTSARKTVIENILGEYGAVISRGYAPHKRVLKGPNGDTAITGLPGSRIPPEHSQN